MDLHRVEFGSKASAQASLFDLHGQVNAACDRCKIERAGNKLKLSFQMNRVSRRSKTAALDTRAELKQSGFFRGSSASLQTMPTAAYCELSLSEQRSDECVLALCAGIQRYACDPDAAIGGAARYNSRRTDVYRLKNRPEFPQCAP